MIIGVDLDETLIDSSIVWKQGFIDMGKENEFEYPLGWTFPNYPESVRQRIYYLFGDSNIMTSIPPFEGVQDRIKELKNNGHTIIVITARHDSVDTIPYVKKLFPEVSQVIVSGYKGSKAEHFESTGIEIWIDDAGHGIMDARYMNIPTIMISNYKTPYNHHIRPETPWVKNFKDIDERMLKIVGRSI